MSAVHFVWNVHDQFFTRCGRRKTEATRVTDVLSRITCSHCLRVMQPKAKAFVADAVMSKRDGIKG